ncbi:MAG: hypothetical protein LAT61_11515 [Alcanivorax sp.]|nr:hypothetical protein [Alcanivorax sp.]
MMEREPVACETAWNGKIVLVFETKINGGYMIEDSGIANQVVKILDGCSSKINETIRFVQDNCSNEEFEEYRRAAGFVMGYIYTDVVAPLYHRHPELEPPELREERS